MGIKITENSPITYKKIPIYKYETKDIFYYQTDVFGYNISTEFIKLDSDGQLTILQGYRWDGASGLTIDTKNSMRASLVHDTFYQLFRLRLLPQNLINHIDDIFKKILIDDGMWKVRVWIWHTVLKIANGNSAKPIKVSKTITIT